MEENLDHLKKITVATLVRHSTIQFRVWWMDWTIIVLWIKTNLLSKRVVRVQAVDLAPKTLIPILQIKITLICTVLINYIKPISWAGYWILQSRMSLQRKLPILLLNLAKPRFQAQETQDRKIITVPYNTITTRVTTAIKTTKILKQ